MRRIVQIVQFMRHGAGVPSVAANLNQPFPDLGVTTELFTFPVAHRGNVERTPRSRLLLVVGRDVKMVSRVRAKAEEPGVGGWVMLIGDQQDPVPYYTIADMFVLPSAYESSELVFLEALACGLPVIATRVGVAAQIVRDGVNGFLVDRDPRQVADRMEIIAALADPASIRAAARASIAGYSWREIATRYLELADEIVRERKTLV